MPKKIKAINTFLLILLNLLSISNTQNLDKSVLKAAGCLTLVKKLKDKPNDQRVATGLLLSCFINIDEETADKLLQNQFYEKMGIEESEVVKLIDFNKLQNKYSQEQLEEYSKALNKALDPLREKGPGDNSGKGPNMYENEEENSENNESIVNYIIKLFTSSDSLLLLFGLFVVFYFCLQKMRKWFGKSGKDTNNKTINNQKSTKSNKNNKKKKK
jgi:hypothetical protein